MTCESNSVEMMFKQECQEIAQELISVTAIMLSKAKPDKAYPEMVRGLVEYGGYELGEAECLANQLIRIVGRQEAVTQ